MSRVLERRKQFLRLMREFTLEKGFFTVTDIADAATVPRSTAQDWIVRLMEEGCIVQIEERRGRHAGHFVSISTLPSTACKRIFTTVDGDCVEIYHECLSGGCAAFCEYHHSLAGGVLKNVKRDGTLLRERGCIGESGVFIGRHPRPAVGVAGISHRDGEIVQKIICFGGPAYSLTDMMSHAEGVCDVVVSKNGHLVEGELITRALTYLAIGIDDTDTREGGATFALALALLQHLSNIRGVIPIAHKVVMLYPEFRWRTAGNSCSFIELAAEPEVVRRVEEAAVRFVGDESFSPRWGIAVKEGFLVPEPMRRYAHLVRKSEISRKDAEDMASGCNVRLHGEEGVIGALAAVSCIGLPTGILLDPSASLPDVV